MKISMILNYYSNIYGEEQSFAEIAKYGFEYVHYSMGFHKKSGLYNKDLDEVETYYRQLKSASESAGIKISEVHSPHRTYGGDDAGINKIILDQQIKGVMITSIFDCPYMVVHPQLIQVDDYSAEIQEKSKAMNLAFFTNLLPYIEKYKIKIAIENLHIKDSANQRRIKAYCSDAEELCDLIDTLNGIAGCERFAACYDSGHAHLLGLKQSHMIKTIGSRLQVLHVNDNHGGFEDEHLPPYEGSIDWDDMCGSLKEIGFKGVFNFEASSDMPDEIDFAGRMFELGNRMVQKYML